MRLSRQLLKGRRPETFSSDCGLTDSIFEPHEFGYFWRNMLGYQDLAEQDEEFEREIDWNRLHRTLVNMTYVADAPIAFKACLLAWHMKKLQDVLPKSVFLWVSRDRVATAISLLNARQRQYGSLERWFSVKPRQHAWLQHQPAATQVAGQVFYFERAIARQVESMRRDSVIRTTYDEICTTPQHCLDRL
ncbi:MAG: hypothetical protein AAF961_01755 [Planctomycetota bacterium]